MARPFRAEHIGSLMRPADLLAARSAAGFTSSYSQVTEDIQRLTDNAIADVVTKQQAAGAWYSSNHVWRVRAGQILLWVLRKTPGHGSN